MDTQNAPTALNTDQAASLFLDALDREPQETEQDPETAQAQPEDAQAPEEPQEAEQEQQDDDPVVTVKIDGKEVEVKLSELKNGYQRQADYTRKTQEVAETRKAAEAEVSRARAERQAYAQNLQLLQAKTLAGLQEQQSIDWESLKQSDPVEFVNQVRIAQERQAALARTQAELQRVSAIEQAEQAQAYQSHLAQQQAELLAKLPEWRDEAKANAERQALRNYLLSEGYGESDVAAVSDAKAVVMARKAMLYDQLMSKADAAAKKVATLPTKALRTGNGNEGIDRRTSAFQRLSKTGRAEDAASLIAGLL